VTWLNIMCRDGAETGGIASTDNVTLMTPYASLVFPLSVVSEIKRVETGDWRVFTRSGERVSGRPASGWIEFLTADGSSRVATKDIEGVLVARRHQLSRSITHGMLAYYAFEYESKAGHDASGNGLTAALKYAAWTPAGIVNGGACGLLEPRATLETARLHFAASDGFAVAGWIKHTSPGALFAFVDGNGGAPVRVDVGNAGRVTMCVDNGLAVVRTLPGVVDGGWHHVALCGDRANLSIYVDGALSARVPYRASSGISGTRLYVGYGRPGGAFTGGLRGIVDEILVMGRGLTDAEVAQLAAMRADRDTPPQPDHTPSG